jgi:hypothetical protein
MITIKIDFIWFYRLLGKAMHYSVEELRDLIERRYDVVYQSKQSYYSAPFQVVKFLNPHKF